MSAENKRVFVNREKELEELVELLSTGDALVLGLAGIGKTALIEKSLEQIHCKSEKNGLIQIRATQATYPGWLLDRLTLRVFQEIELSKSLSDKMKDWFSKNGPDLYQTIKEIVETSSKVLGNQIILPSINLPSHTTEKNLKSDFAFLTLIDQFTKQADKDLYIVIEDVHLLAEIDKSFLTDLLANHSNKVHVLLSRRPLEKNATLFSSAEMSYLMKNNRIVELSGLDLVASEQLAKAYGITYNFGILKQMAERLRGNPYFLTLLITSVKRNQSSLTELGLAPLSKQNSNDITKYLQSQYVENFAEFGKLLNAASVLPSNIHAEVLSEILQDPSCQSIQEQLLELERRGLLEKDETFGGYRLYHPLLASHIYSQLALSEKIKMHLLAAMYYHKKAKALPSPLNMIATLYHAEQADDSNLQYWALFNFGVIYYQVRRLKESKKNFEKALELAIKLKSEDKEFEALALIFEVSQGVMIDQIEQKLTRIKYLSQRRKGNKRDQIKAAWAETNYYMSLGLLPEAIRSIKKCCVLANRVKDSHNYLYYNHTLATLLADCHRFNEARELLLTCLNGFEKLNDPSGQMMVLQELGNVEIYSNPKKAIEYNHRSMQIAESITDELVMANAYHGIGVAYFELKQYDEAEKNFLKSIELTKQVGDLKGLVTTYVELAGLMIKIERLHEATEFITNAIRIV